MASSTPESATAESIEAVLAIDGWRGGPPDTPGNHFAYLFAASFGLSSALCSFCFAFM